MERVYAERMTVRSLARVAVASVRPIGIGPVIGLTTEPDHTLIADGIVGHNTNARTRPRMLARTREVVMERSAVIHSKRLFAQLSAFGENDAGKMEALAGRDDLLFAWGIALMSRSENFFIMPSTSAAPPQQPDWQSLGLRVIQPETLSDRLRRLTALGQQPGERSFLEL